MRELEWKKRAKTVFITVETASLIIKLLARKFHFTEQRVFPIHKAGESDFEWNLNREQEKRTGFLSLSAANWDNFEKWLRWA